MINKEMTMRAKAIMLASVAGLALLSGCAATQGINHDDWDHGARRGWVVERFAPDRPPATLPACLAALPANEYTTHRFVRVRYHRVRLMHDVIAELPPGLELHDGDRVQVWPADCAAGHIARISAVLLPTPPGAEPPMRPAEASVPQ